MKEVKIGIDDLKKLKIKDIRKIYKDLECEPYYKKTLKKLKREVS